MRIRVAGVFAMVLVAIMAAAAPAARIEVGQGVAHPLFRGSDALGRVSFVLGFGRTKGAHPHGVNEVLQLHFANRCFSSGSTVPVAIAVRRHAFVYRGNGYEIRGSFDSKVTQASGTVRFAAGGCDSGTLDFSAALPS